MCWLHVPNNYVIAFAFRNRAKEQSHVVPTAINYFADEPIISDGRHEEVVSNYARQAPTTGCGFGTGLHISLQNILGCCLAKQKSFYTAKSKTELGAWPRSYDVLKSTRPGLDALRSAVASEEATHLS